MTAVPTFDADNEILDFILSVPTAEQVITPRPSTFMQERLGWLLNGNRNHTLVDAERAELQSYLELEHFIRRLKIRAHERQQETHNQRL